MSKNLAARPPPAGGVGVEGVLVMAQAMVLAFFIAGTHGWLSGGKIAPNTTDFASFYAAGRLANEGRPADAYDRAQHYRAEQAATAQGVKYQYFFNPPPYLLVNQLLALLPYTVSFVLFEAATLWLWLYLGTRVSGRTADAAWLLTVPSVWWVLGLGQNSFLNASLIAAGTLLLAERPILAGIAFGALCYKPHLGLLLPVALIAGRQWRALLAAAGTVLLLCAATLMLYGVPTWRAFVAMVGQSGSAIGTGDVLFAAHIDPVGVLHYAGAAWWLARGAGALVALGVVSAVAWAWARPARPAPRYALLVSGILMTVPFALFYDLILASLAACWLVRDAREHGFLRGEKAALTACLVLNLLASVPVMARLESGVAWGGLVAPTLFALAWRRRRLVA